MTYLRIFMGVMFGLFYSQLGLAARQNDECPQGSKLQIESRNLSFCVDENSLKKILEMRGVLYKYNDGSEKFVRWVAEIKDGKRDGKQIRFSEKKSGEQGKEILVRKYYYSNGKKKSYSKRLNDRFLITKKWHKNGRLKESKRYRLGKKRGRHKRWYENGQIALSQKYKKGKLDGLVKEFQPDGLLVKLSSYKRGKMDGPSSERYLDGKIFLEKNYQEGQIEGEKIYHRKDGSLGSSSHYHAGLEHGKIEQFYKDGQLGLLGEYKKGQYHGLWKRYYENGQLNLSGQFQNHLRVGLWKEYRQDGQLKATYDYNNKKDRRLKRKGYRFEDRMQSPYLSWVQFSLTNSYGEAIAGAQYTVELPDGTTRKGKTNLRGKVLVEYITDGDAQIKFNNYIDLIFEQKLKSLLKQ